jgi:hypothetical protein
MQCPLTSVLWVPSKFYGAHLQRKELKSHGNDGSGPDFGPRHFGPFHRHLPANSQKRMLRTTSCEIQLHAGLNW